MRLAELVNASREIAGTRARNRKIDRLAALLGGRPPEALAIVVPWLSGEMRQGRIGVGWSTLGGLRDTVPASASALRVGDVDAALTAIGSMSGTGSAGRRAAALRDLLGAATPDEQAFLVALILGELRQGALAGILAEAVAKAANVPSDAVRRAAMLSGDLAAAALAALTEGEAALARFRLALFRPVQPMLAQTAEGVEDAFARLGAAALEAKLDGARVQVHRDGERVSVFTRSLHDVTAAVPEVVEAVLALPVRRAILDGEVLALRPDGSPHPFQTTMRRFGRKLDVAAVRGEIPLTPFFFDALLVDDDEMLGCAQADRFAALGRVAGSWLVPHARATDAEAAQAFLDRVVGAGHEGIMAKDPAAPYDAGSRGAGWLKIKRPYTLDLVVLAAEWGSGRRQGWLSNLHLGARDPEGGHVMLGKTFKGLTDEVLAWQTAALLARETRREGPVVHVRPELVVEIAFDELQESPRYPGGLALRFARVKRYRADKTAAEADTIDTVRALHRQDRAAGRGER